MISFANFVSRIKGVFTAKPHPDFSWKSTFLQWSLGMYFATPVIAVLQGSFLLNDYRVRHADAPLPIMPARGVAVAVEDDTTDSSKSSSSFSIWRLRRPILPASQSPLRLLVVGDSLAAGVGVSKSGVPILPESIARALSKALQGRAVHWTCVGTPGVAASQIVKDIHGIEPYDPTPRAMQMDRIIQEFQARRRLWMEHRLRRQQQEAQQLATIEGATIEVKPKDNETSKNYLLQWWNQIQDYNQDSRGFKSPKEIRETTRHNIEEWWEIVRNRFRVRREKVEEDINVIKDIALEPLPILDDEDDNYFYDYYRDNPLEEQQGAPQSGGEMSPPKLPLLRKGSFFRRSSVNPEAAAQYDIAVVLTGLNDVKEAFMPHMQMESSKKDISSSTEESGDRRLQTALFMVLKALQDKMRGMDLEDGTGTTTGAAGSQRQSTPLKRPLVVVPELPVAPLQFFRLAPLCWLLIPIFRAMEENKKFLASCFPQYVVFVEQPDLHWWTDNEAGIGPVRDNIQEEQLLLRVTDITHAARERIEKLMKQYYGEEEEENNVDAPGKPNNDNGNIQCVIDNDSKMRMMCDHDHLHYDVDRERNSKDRFLGSNLVSIDKVHPNDEGYELWGRHIAAAIIHHWNED